MEDIKIADRLQLIVQPYFGRGSIVDFSAKLMADLGITGSDYLELVADLKRVFEVDLDAFLMGPDPQYVSTGLVGWIAGEPNKPVYRDVSIEEILEFLQATQSER